MLTVADDGSFVLSGTHYPFVETSGSNIAGTFHDFDIAGSHMETAYTRWQTVALAVSNVPADLSGIWPAIRTFKVAVYRPRELDAIQTFMDDESTRNAVADYVVRGAIPCLVQLSVPVYKRSSVELDTNEMRLALINLINGRKFGETLTASLISTLLHAYDIGKVGLDVGPGA